MLPIKHKQVPTPLSLKSETRLTPTPQQLRGDQERTAMAPKTFHEFLGSLIGHSVTIINSESYEDAPVGHQIRHSFYRAKCICLEEDYIVLHGSYVHSSTKASKEHVTEPILQYLPISRIKRVSILEGQRLIHI